MPVIKEKGGQLNAFAKEPKIEVINQASSDSNVSRVILLVGFLVLAGLISITMNLT